MREVRELGGVGDLGRVHVRGAGGIGMEYRPCLLECAKGVQGGESVHLGCAGVEGNARLGEMGIYWRGCIIKFNGIPELRAIQNSIWHTKWAWQTSGLLPSTYG